VTPVKYVGIDVHKKMCQAAVLDEDGALLDELRFANDPEGIEEFAGKLTTFRDEIRAMVESTRNLSDSNELDGAHPGTCARDRPAQDLRGVAE
jgi:hypothetical protein